MINSVASDDFLDAGPPVIAWSCGYCRCCTQDIMRRDCDFCLSEHPNRYLVFGGPIDHLVPAYGRVSISFGASPIEVDGSVIAWECGFCKCTTKDLDRRDCPFCLVQVATRHGIFRGSFDPSIGRVSIIRADLPMDDPDDNAQLWERILRRP
jgi:hypothetical protein